MGRQLKLFEQPEEISKIQQLIESSSCHELGVKLAIEQGFNKVNILIELCRHHLDRIDFDAWFNRTTEAYDLCEFEFEGCKWFIIEVDSDAFYLQAERGENVEISASVKTWYMNEKWGDFDLFAITARHIKTNRETYDSIIKNKSDLKECKYLSRFRYDSECPEIG